MEMWVLVVLLAINFVAAVAFMIKKRDSFDHAGLWGLFFLLVPGFGFLIYAIEHGFGAPRSTAPTPQDVSSGPGDTEEARRRNLKQLRKDLEGNYRFLLLAKRDEEPEDVPYYAQTAKEETRRSDEAHWVQCQRSFEQNPDDPKAFHAACSALMKLTQDSTPSDSDQEDYRSDLCHLVQSELNKHPDVVAPTEYETCLQTLIDMKSYDAAEELWKDAPSRLRTETAYEEMLAMFYTLRDRAKFQSTLEDLRKDDKIRLSSTGREQMQYWSKRLASAS